MPGFMYLALGIILIFSILGVISPGTAFHLGEGWKYKNVEPSDLNLLATRVSSAIGAVIIIIIMLKF